MRNEQNYVSLSTNDLIINFGCTCNFFKIKKLLENIACDSLNKG